MKKSLIALAVLAASGAAMAQSSVTLNGRVGVWVGTLEQGVGQQSQTVLQNGGLTGSRWALNGTEDLGSGLKAMFKLENRYNIDDGKSVGGFSGDAYVALAGGFGTVKLGRTYTAFDDARVLANSQNVFDSDLTPTGAVFKADVKQVTNVGVANGTTGADYTSRAPNGIRYETPKMSGFGAALTYAFGEDKSATTDASNLVSLSLNYAAGPLAVSYGYQEEKFAGTAANVTAGTAGTTSNKYNALSASYNFGMAAVSAGYQKRAGTAATGDDTGYTLGVTAPLGSAMNVSFGYAKEDTEIAGVTTAKNSGWALGLGYSMSKRTTLFAGFQDVSQDNAAGTEVGKQRILAAGLRHNF